MNYAEIVSAARDAPERLVEIDRRDGHALVTLGDPGRRNALSAALMVQLHDACAELVADETIRAVALTGAGEAFSAGGDLRMMEAFVADGRDGDEGAFMPHRWIRQRFGAFARLVAGSPTAFVAALNGAAAGVGLAFALTCDVVLAGESAAIVPAFARLGLVPEVGTSWALTRALGYRRAFAFYVRGEHLDARAAHALGLVDEVVADDELAATTDDWCGRIAQLPAHAVPLTKPLLRAAADQPWEQALLLEELAEPICFTTRDFADGVRSVVAATSGARR